MNKKIMHKLFATLFALSLMQNKALVSMELSHNNMNQLTELPTDMFDHICTDISNTDQAYTLMFLTPTKESFKKNFAQLNVDHFSLNNLSCTSKETQKAVKDFLSRRMPRAQTLWKDYGQGYEEIHLNFMYFMPTDKFGKFFIVNNPNPVSCVQNKDQAKIADLINQIALYMAAWTNKSQVINKLVADKNVNLSAVINPQFMFDSDSTGETALHAALKGNSPEAFTTLIKHNADITVVSEPYRNTLLHYTILYNQLDFIPQLRKLANTENVYEYTPLQCALLPSYTCDKPKAVQELIAIGANPNEKYKRQCAGSIPLHIAITQCKEAVPQLLKSAIIDINIQDAHGDTPSHLAVRMRAVDTLQALVDKGANILITNEYNLTPIDMANTRNDEKSIRIQEILSEPRYFRIFKRTMTNWFDS